MTPGPRSARRPWIRGGLSGLLVALAPFAWVLEVDSCGSAPQAREYTGVELASKLDGEAWAIFGLLFAFCVGGVFFARRLAPRWRLVLHTLSAIATGFLVYLGTFFLFFTLFSTRTLEPAGVGVVALLFGLATDAVARLFFGVREWLESRRATSAAPPPG